MNAFCEAETIGGRVGGYTRCSRQLDLGARAPHHSGLDNEIKKCCLDFTTCHTMDKKRCVHA
jgi:hypothetical protein